MSITIFKQGLFDTIHDAGRYGWQHLGINPGGVMDEIASSIANMLVGNNIHESVIEMHFPAPIIQFNEPCIIALCGADFSATINEEVIPLRTTIVMGPATQLSFKQHKKGARCYLAVHGGWEAIKWLNSYSTNTKLKAGGFEGRPLIKNDIVCFNIKQPVNELPEESFVLTPLKTYATSFHVSTNIIRCIKGREFEWLDESSKHALQSLPFRIAAQSDRMGYRLTGNMLQSKMQKQLLSSAVTKGTIQLLPDGELILLMADHQTTGGYPVVACAISSDIPSLAQMQPGSIIQFNFISPGEAEDLYFTQQQNLLQLYDACTLQFNKFFNR